MGKVTIRTSDGKVYTDPSQIHIPRNEKTAMFYKIVDEYQVKPKKKDDGDKTA